MNTGYIVSDATLLSELSLTQRNNVFWTIVYIRGGIGMYLLDSALRSLNEGDIIILPPGVQFSFRSDDLGDEYNVNIDAAVLRFDKSWLNAVLTAFPVASEMALKIRERENPSAVTGTKWIRLAALLDEMAVCSKNVQPLKMFGILELLADRKDEVCIVSGLQSDPGDLSARKGKIDSYLECTFSSKVTLGQVAEYVGMSRVYFSVYFKSQYGEGFADYLNRLRVQKSVDLLVMTDKPLAMIATECGFKTVQYFTRIFSKLMGQTPGAYRKEKAALCTRTTDIY